MIELPTFAIAGDPNVGKSTLVATLAEDDSVEIDRRARTTRRATAYRSMIDGQPVLEFIDLPGFENTSYLKKWFEEHRRDRGRIKTFLDEHAGEERFQPECEILGALEGAAVIFVADASRPVEPRDRDQAEILRLCTNRRMSVINVREDRAPAGGDDPLLADWKDMLGQHGPVTQFNAHRANFADRIGLLTFAAEVVQDWRGQMKEVIAAHEEDWYGRRLQEVSHQLCRLVEGVMQIRQTAPVKLAEAQEEKGTRGAAEKAARQAAEARAKGAVMDDVRRLEEAYRQEVRAIFKHRREGWALPEGDFLDEDIFSDETWELLGLSRGQLVWAGAATGLVIGAGIDAVVGGASVLIGSVIGTATGALLAWHRSGESISVKLPKVKLGGLPVGVGGTTLESSRKVEARIQPESNLIWILLDRCLIYVAVAANWSHGRKAAHPQAAGGEKSGLVSTWDKEDKKPLVQWHGALRSKKVGQQKLEQLEADAREFLLGQVKRLTTSG